MAYLQPVLNFNDLYITKFISINEDPYFKGYIFSVDNTVKDLSYINEMLKDLPNAAKLSSIAKSFYKEASDKGYGDLLISELIEK